MKKNILSVIIAGIYFLGLGHNVIATNNYVSQNNKLENFNVSNALNQIKELEYSVEEIKSKLFELDNKETDVNGISSKYREVRNEIVNVIQTINSTTKEVSGILKKLAVYKKQIYISQNELKQTRLELEKTKKYMKNFTNFFYKIDNDLYTSQKDKIDEIKLLLKSDNIPKTLANDYLIKSMVEKFNLLIDNFEKKEKYQIKLIKNLNKLQINAKNQLKNYDNELDKLKQKKNYLLQFLELYQNERYKKLNNLNNVYDSVKDVYDSIDVFMDDIMNGNDKIGFDLKEKIKKLKEIEKKQDDKYYPVARPIYPIVYIQRYFNDKTFEKQYGVPHEGIQIIAKQGSPVYSSRAGIVYHVVENENIGINRVMVYHSENYVSVYRYLNKILIKPGDIVRRGELIGYSGGEPGTKGAGFISKGANLTYSLYKEGKAVDPLLFLDSSVVKNKDILPDNYHIKYLKDKYSRPIDITEIEFMKGPNTLYRADQFLNLYGIGIYKELAFWEDAVKETNIDRDVVICIGFAESTLGNYLSTDNNIGNVGNNDRGDRVSFSNALAGAKAIADTLNNQHLGKYHTINQLSRYGNKDGKIYASSKINWQTNVLKCLSQIKGYYIPEDFPFRIGPNPNLIEDKIIDSNPMDLEF